MYSKDADRRADSVDYDQTAHKEQSDLGQLCMLRHVYPITYTFNGIV